MAAASPRINYFETWTAQRALSAAALPGLRTSEAGEPMLFDAYGRSFDLQLEPNDRFIAPAARVKPELAQRLKFYSGHIVGSPASWLRLMRNGEEWRGVIWDGREMYVIEPARSVAALVVAPVPSTPGAHVIYRLSDTSAPSSGEFCGASLASETPATSQLEAYRELTAELTPSAATLTANKELTVAAIEDYEFTSALGDAADARALSYLQVVDGIFSAQLGVHLAVTLIKSFSTPDQPFSGTSPAALLCQVGAYKYSQSGLRPLGIAHLFTGRSLDGSTVGIAYTASICGPAGRDSSNCGSSTVDFASSLSEGLHQNKINGSLYPASALIAAHEIGHNFGAVHDGETGKACASTSPSQFLMAATLNGSATFSQCSLDSINAKLRAVPTSCLASYDGTGANISVRPVAAAAPALALDATRSMDFTVDAAGGANAQVSASIDVTGGISVTDLVAAGSTCDIAARRCTIGTLARGESATVTATFHGDSAGPATISARVSATLDADGTDDSTQAEFNVGTGADLSSSLLSSAQTLTLQSSATINAAVVNNSSIDADGVTLSVAIPSGLEAALPAGCQTTSSGFSCAVADLSAGTSRDFEFSVQATQSGSQTISAQAQSLDADPQPANDSSQTTLTVAASSSSGASAKKSGGGGLGWVALAFLGAAVARRIALRVTCAGLP